MLIEVEGGMRDNVGRGDAAIRLLLALVAAAVAVSISGANLASSLAAALGAVVLVATGLTRKCPIYALLGLDTCSRRRRGVDV